MLDSGLLSKNFIGRDGFIWWIGQVPDAKFWKGNLPTLPQDDPSSLPGFKYRVKVRILGYHTADLNSLSDEDLPWALVMLPTTAGSGSGANAITPRFSGGEFVFGFFLDGDNGQQPVIIGTLGNSTQTVLSKSLPSVGFKPFSGHTSTGKQVPSYGLKDSKGVDKSTVPNNNQSIPSGSKGGTPNIVVSGNSSLPGTSPNQESSNSTGDTKTAHQERQQDNNKEFPLGNACKKDKKKKEGIKSAIKELVRVISGVQKYYDAYVSPTLNMAQNISSQISLCAGLIAGYLKDLLNNWRHDLFVEINKRVKKLQSRLSTKKQIQSGEVQQKSIDAIGCIFNKIIDSLFSLVEEFLTKFLDRIFDAVECLIDTMIGSLLDSIIGPLEGAISSALGPLNNLISGFSGGLSQALNFTSMIQNFLSCEEEDECPEVETWSWLDGPKPGTEDDYSNALSNVSAKGLGNLLGNPSVSSLRSGSLISCLSGPSLCGPPKIEIFGGGGSGASANAIIGDDGEILAVDLLTSGIDYYSNPFVYFDDPCGNGSGARAEAIVGTDGNDCGKLIEIRVVNGGKGYKKRSDGSLGSNGKTLVGVGSDAKAMVLPSGANFNISKSSFSFNKLSGIITSSSGVSTSVLASGVQIPCGVVTTYSSIAAYLRLGSTVTLPKNASIIVPTSTSLTNLPSNVQQNGNTYTFPSGGTITIPVGIGTTSNVPATSTISNYGVVLEIKEILVKNSGINYSPNDKICITPDNGSNLVPQFDPYGRLVSVKILNKGTFVTARPTISICDSDTGINAEMFAVLSPRRVTSEEAQTLGFDQDKLITVVDCVGKVNV